MDKEKNKNRAAQAMLDEMQKEVIAFDPKERPFSKAFTSPLDEHLNISAQLAEVEQSKIKVEVKDSPAMKILKALEQRLKVEIVNFQGQEYYKLIGELYLQPNSEVSILQSYN